MTTRNEIQAQQAVSDYTRRNARLIYYGALGNNAGTVNHATRNDWVYVRLHGDSNQVVEAYAAASFPHVNNVIVDVEKVLRKGAPYYQILGVSAGITYATVNNPFPGMPGYHALTHQRRDFGAGGPDPLDVYTRALVNLRARAQATPDLTVYVERGFYFIGGILQEWTGGSSSAFTAPAGSPLLTVRRCDLLYIGDDYALHIVQGRVVTDGSLPPFPTTPIPCVPVAFVYLSNMSSTITESLIRDARLVASAIDLTLDRAVCHNDSVICHDDEIVYL